MAWMGIPGGSDNREFACNTGGLGSMSRSGRSPGEGNPLQYSFLENSMDREAWRATAGGHKELDPTEWPRTPDLVSASYLEKSEGLRLNGDDCKKKRQWVKLHFLRLEEPVYVFSHRTLRGSQASDVLKGSWLRRACSWASQKASSCAAQQSRHLGIYWDRQKTFTV